MVMSNVTFKDSFIYNNAKYFLENNTLFLFILNLLLYFLQLDNNNIFSFADWEEW